MPFIPHAKTDIEAMLSAIGVSSVDDLFSEIPKELLQTNINQVPVGLSEMELNRLLTRRGKKDHVELSFVGAGAYEHHIPQATLDLISRGEFLTAYTPYQAEASQGSLQLIYEFQTMLTNLTGMQASNASLYDGASALAEAVLMAVRCQRRSTAKTILMPASVHPFYRQAVQTIVSPQEIELIEVPYCAETGTTLLSALQKYNNRDITALVIPQPNFFGCLEAVDELTNWAHQQNAMVIACVNPLALALLKPPGEWGETGADIVCGEGQSLGVPLASGGPYFGFMTTKKEFLRQMPGRIVGRTTDINGETGFALTLQAREQHIRRSKATSNICTNQGLMVVAATIYMSLLGAKGLYHVASQAHANAVRLKQALANIDGVRNVFSSSIFHEFVIRLSQPVDIVLNKLAKKSIQAGFALKPVYAELDDCLLVCATETKTEQDLQYFIDEFAKVLTTDTNTNQHNQINGVSNDAGVTHVNL